MLTTAARPLGLSDRAAVERLLDCAPIAAAQVAERVRGLGLGRWRIEGQLLGYGPRGRPQALCWVGANLMPFAPGDLDAVAAFADVLNVRPRAWTSIVGSADTVLALWERLAPAWAPAREVRAVQPLLATYAPPLVAADPAVRLVRPHEIDQLYPAAVAMYTEEVGVSPARDDGGQGYRERFVDLVQDGRAYARLEGGRVVFKAELAVVTRHTAQVQGVWVAPEWRGRGLGTAGMAAVVNDVLRRVAPSVSLYVNDYNQPARRAYVRCGFRQVGTFATVLL